jgi:hypothetical protein
MLKILLCSGAPAAGKDTVGEFLPGIHKEKFAKPLRDAAKAFYGWSDETLEWQKRTDSTTGERRRPHSASDTTRNTTGNCKVRESVSRKFTDICRR